MQLPITRIDKTLPLPKYETSGSVAFDLYVRETTTVRPNELALLPANLIVQIPSGFTLILAARSSTPKKGLSVPHGIGIIDQDFRGPNDELKIQVMNWTDRPITVERGERIAQALIVPVAQVELVEHEVVVTTSRSGFGSTG
ncbi:dUTP diphosphatase [Candidatus Uhrbacteria bacterium CG_4_10_14_0_8_um_filter_58_22]|uniref:dUTP diphosphatase n=1 Tax=Candidatus Uhrbacteria bacterium CG_4_10_14_0_8_um_filter_58_22 TaxID=1975029 RepID=A0A2M7Q953_9BACT|nr:MAG: dUTPase [Parcubacteria group bacterium CG1_02_58_44]PIY61991.1 MAG: dUTP diphosphatase [Candidatus Uhrbacteria bacterium CG_4_10_14_0_8_um_filter_58_22]